VQAYRLKALEFATNKRPRHCAGLFRPNKFTHSNMNRQV
jgi:hypothetical protein